MVNHPFCTHRSRCQRFRQPGFEQLESRCMLSGAEADIVFLVDESQSEVGVGLHEWLRARHR